MLRRSIRLSDSCCAIATSRIEPATYLLAGQLVVHVVQTCAGIAAASPRINDTRRQRVALRRPGLLPGAGAVTGGRDGRAAARARGLPASRAAAAVGPLRDRPRRRAPSTAPRAADARDRLHHRRAAAAPRSGGNQPQGGIARLG